MDKLTGLHFNTVVEITLTVYKVRQTVTAEWNEKVLGWTSMHKLIKTYVNTISHQTQTGKWLKNCFKEGHTGYLWVMINKTILNSRENIRNKFIYKNYMRSKTQFRGNIKTSVSSMTNLWAILKPANRQWNRIDLISNKIELQFGTTFSTWFSLPKANWNWKSGCFQFQ